MDETTKATCELCGEPMPEGEEMFKFHGYSGNCPKPALPRKTKAELLMEKIRSSDKTFGLVDNKGNGSAILISDLEEIIKEHLSV